MPEIRLKSQQKEPGPSSRKQAQPRTSEPPTKAPRRAAILDESGFALRREALERLTAIQINTAGLSGPYRTDKETMELVCGNHSAVRAVRIVMRRSLILPRKGSLCRALLALALERCDGRHGQAARMLGLTARELRRVLGSPRSNITPAQTRLSLVE